jgi:hypothetical protein
MADFVASFLSKRTPQFVAHDPMDYVAVFAPLLADTVRPTVELLSPAQGQIGRTQAVVARIRDDRAVSALHIWIAYPSGEWETAYARGSFSRRFRRSSLTGAATDQTLTLIREGGWPYGELEVNVDPVDAGGNTAL